MGSTILFRNRFTGARERLYYLVNGWDKNPTHELGVPAGIGLPGNKKEGVEPSGAAYVDDQQR